MENQSGLNSQPDAGSKQTALGSHLKNLYRGKFVLNKQSITLYGYAYTEKQAWLLFCQRIAKKHGLPYSAVQDYFGPGKGNYNIETEIEITD